MQASLDPAARDSSRDRTSATVSVVIPAFNVEQCIERAIVSALRQTAPPLEIVVVDDGSSDGTVDVVNAVRDRDPSVRLIRHEQNKGPGAARNTGIRASRADWIAILDADDWFEDDRLNYLVAEASARSLDFAADNLRFYDLAAGATSRLAIAPQALSEPVTLNLQTFLVNCQAGNARAVDFGLLKPIMKRTRLQDLGLLYDESCRHGEDFVHYFNALGAGATFGVFPRVGYVQTERVGSLSGAQSGLSRTVVDYERMERDTLSLLDHAAASDPEVRRLLIARAAHVADLALWSRFTTAVRGREFASAGRMLASDRGRRIAALAARRGLRRAFASVGRSRSFEL